MHSIIPFLENSYMYTARQRYEELYIKVLSEWVKLLSRVRLFATLWTVAYQAPLSVGFSRQEYWSGLPFPSPGDLPNPGIKPRSPTLQADTLPSEPPGKPYHTYLWVSSVIMDFNVPHHFVHFAYYFYNLFTICKSISRSQTKEWSQSLDPSSV